MSTEIPCKSTGSGQDTHHFGSLCMCPEGSPARFCGPGESSVMCSGGLHAFNHAFIQQLIIFRSQKVFEDLGVPIFFPFYRNCS